MYVCLTIYINVNVRMFNNLYINVNVRMLNNLST
jgi:hypothetical protein